MIVIMIDDTIDIDGDYNITGIDIVICIIDTSPHTL